MQPHNEERGGGGGGGGEEGEGGEEEERKKERRGRRGEGRRREREREREREVSELWKEALLGAKSVLLLCSSVFVGLCGGTFMSTCHKLESFWKRELQLRECPH